MHIFKKLSGIVGRAGSIEAGFNVPHLTLGAMQGFVWGEWTYLNQPNRFQNMLSMENWRSTDRHFSSFRKTCIYFILQEMEHVFVGVRNCWGMEEAKKWRAGSWSDPITTQFTVFVARPTQCTLLVATKPLESIFLRSLNFPPKTVGICTDMSIVETFSETALRGTFIHPWLYSKLVVSGAIAVSCI